MSECEIKSSVFKNCSTFINKHKIKINFTEGSMFKKLRKTVLLVVATANVFLLNMVTFATGDVDAPTLTEVKAIVNDGLDLFFGALGAFAVIMGGVEFYKGFLSFRDADARGGFGESKSKGIHHIIAGVFCLIGGVIVFVVLGWAKDLFSI